MMKQIALLVFPGTVLLDLSGPMQVLDGARQFTAPGQGYRLRVFSPEGGQIETDTALSIGTEPLGAFDTETLDTLLVIGVNGAPSARQRWVAVEAIHRLAPHARRIGSVCTGAFFLAAAGLLDGRRAVTHWRHCDAFAEQFPAVRVARDPIYVRDGNVWTSAGVTSGIDLSLAIVAEDWGRCVALHIARDIVTYMVRPGGQMQFSQILSHQLEDVSGAFDELQAWIRCNLRSDLRVETLANRLAMTPRTFARKFTHTFGRPPAKYVEAVRLEAAMAELIETDQPIKAIAARCGFFDDERMRRAFQRQIGVAPTEYRERFGGA